MCESTSQPCSNVSCTYYTLSSSLQIHLQSKVRKKKYIVLQGIVLWAGKNTNVDCIFPLAFTSFYRKPHIRLWLFPACSKQLPSPSCSTLNMPSRLLPQGLGPAVHSPDNA